MTLFVISVYRCRSPLDVYHRVRLVILSRGIYRVIRPCVDSSTSEEEVILREENSKVENNEQNFLVWDSEYMYRVHLTISYFTTVVYLEAQWALLDILMTKRNLYIGNKYL